MLACQFADPQRQFARRQPGKMVFNGRPEVGIRISRRQDFAAKPNFTVRTESDLDLFTPE